MTNLRDLFKNEDRDEWDNDHYEDNATYLTDWAGLTSDTEEQAIDKATE